MKNKWLRSTIAAALFVPFLAAPVMTEAAAFDYKELYQGIDYQNKTTCVIGHDSALTLAIAVWLLDLL